MKRDYGDDTYKRLERQIDEISTETMSPILDQLGDIAFRLGKEIGVINLYDDLKNVESYHKMVLDMTDMTKLKLKKIFTEVKSIDNSYSKEFDRINERQNIYLRKLKELNEMIHPNFSIENAGTINKICNEYNKNLIKYDKEIAEDYRTEINIAQKRMAIESGKTLLKGFVNIAYDIASMPFDWVMTLRVKGMKAFGESVVTDSWGLVNDVFTFCGGGAGLISAGAIGICTILNLKCESVMKAGEKYSVAKGVADVMEADETSGAGGMAKVVRGIDTGIEIIDTKNDINDLFKPDAIKKKEKAFKKIKKWKQFAEQKELASKIKKIYKTASLEFDLFEGKEADDIKKEVAKKIKENNKFLKTASEIINFDTTSFITNVY